MKKVLAILLALSVLALSACAAKQANSDTQKDSNTAETEQQPDSAQTAETQQPAQEAKRIEPLAESLDLNALTDATVAASFGAEDISEKDGKTEITLTVYDYDVYDMVDISQLAVGDTIVVDGKDMVVTSREDKDGFVTINGGLEQGGVDLTSDDSGRLLCRWLGRCEVVSRAWQNHRAGRGRLCPDRQCRPRSIRMRPMPRLTLQSWLRLNPASPPTTRWRPSNTAN